MRRADRRRWGLSLAGVVLAHALALVAALEWPTTPVPPATPAAALQLELAPDPVAPPAMATELAPGPPQQEQQAAARSPRTAAQPVPDTPPQPDPAAALPRPVPTPTPEPSPATPSPDGEAAADVEQSRAPPSVQAPPGQRYAAARSLSGSQREALATWQAQVLGHLERYKRYPRPAQRRRQEGVVQVQFAVDRQGRAREVHVVQGSGHDALDAETLATVQRADPLPPPPPEVEGDPVQVRVPVDFFLQRR